MPPPYSKGDRVKCLATMWDLSDSDDEGGSSTGDKPDQFSESHMAKTGSRYVYGTVTTRLRPWTSRNYSVRWDALSKSS